MRLTDEEQGWRTYQRTNLAEMRPWTPGVEMARVSVSVADAEAGSPKPGDMIARNPANHDDQWLVAADYFAANFAAVPRLAASAPGEREEVGRLRAFAAWAMEAHTGSLEGWEIEERACQLGLMEAALCDGTCANCESVPGEDICYRPLLTAPAPTEGREP